MTQTPIDMAFAEMESGGDTERLRFFDRVAGAELFLLLDEEPVGDDVKPAIFDTEEGSFVLAFDTEDRLASFVGGPAPYVALSGRTIAQTLAGQGVGMGLNLEAAPSSILLPDTALSWLAETLDQTPQEMGATPEEVRAPHGLPEALLTALDARLAAAEGLARMAYLVGVTYEGGGKGHLLAVIGAVPGSEAALARAVSEALIFSGLEAGALDVAFFDASDPMAARLARVGLRFDLPQPAPKGLHPAAPGSDPDRPPKLV